jgi:hypothetical protein
MTRTILVSVVAGALALSACGTPSDDAAQKDEGGIVVLEDTFANAAVSTMDAGSARMSMRMSMAAPGVPADSEIAADGVMAFDSGNFSMTMDMGPLVAAIVAESGGDHTGDLTVEMRMVDYVMYMRYPEALAAEMGDLPTPWLSIDLRAALDELGLSEDVLEQYQQNDPTQYLQFLGAVSSGIEEVGREKVRDVDTTHYRAAIDLRKALDQMPHELTDGLGLDEEALRRSFEQMQSELDVNELPTEAWIDDDGLLRRMRIEMGAAGVGAKVELELYDYGVAVDVVAPPADQVTDLLSVFGGLDA